MTQFQTRHGLTDTRIHRSWMSMLGRCERPTDRAYANYGGRGIKVCERWQTFENFLADMGPMPEDGTLERIDVNKGYAPENCRWATKAEQSKNTRRTRLFEHKGRTLYLKDWAREAGIRYETLRYRVLTRGMPIGEALRAAGMTASEAAALGAEARWGRHEVSARQEPARGAGRGHRPRNAQAAGIAWSSNRGAGGAVLSTPTRPVLRDHGTAAELWHRLRFTPFARTEFDAAYSDPTDPVDQAHKLTMRSFMGHGSDSATRRTQPGFRTKRSRSGTEGGGFTRSPACEFAAYPDAIHGFHERLAGVVIESRHAIDLIHQFDSPTTLIYADPPYVLSSRTLMRGSSNSSHGYRHEMSDDDHRALAECLRNCRSMVVLSGYASDLYDRELYPDWQRFERKAVAEAGKARTEVVWLNHACSTALIGQQAQQRLIA